MSFLKNYITDAARQMGKLDDAQSVYAQHLVTATLQELFRFEYRATPWASGELISISTNMDEGAYSVAWQMLGDVGGAGIVADNATDIPTADLEGTLNLNKAHTVATSIYYSTQDIRAARMQNMFDIATEKAQSARQAHDREIDRLIRLGSVPQALTGIVDAPGSWHVTVTTGSWNTVATPSQIAADFEQGWDAIFNGTGGVEEPDTAVFASSVWGHLNSTQNSIASDITILEFLKRSHPGITLWKVDSGLNTAADDGTAAVMLFNRSPSKVRVLMPMLLKPLPLEQHGLVFKMVFESRYAGLATPHPKSVAKLQNSLAT
jgi:hypothetical protein